jgi:8-amino-7-oxononanoate synthase
MDFPLKLHQQLDKRRIEGGFRRLTLLTDCVDFSSNDYLGFSGNRDIFERVVQEMKDLGPFTGSSGSRLLTGNHEVHELLEQQVSYFFGTEDALLFNSGYDANVGLLSTVPQRGDRVFYDAFVHASLRDGIRLSNAASYSFKHNDVTDLLQKIEKTASGGDTYVVVESIYSMDGDQAPLKELAELVQKTSVHLIVDEAHSTGIYGPGGRGLVRELNLEHFVFARVHTFGKALGCHGAVVAGSQLLKSFLVNFSRPFIYTTAMPLFDVLSIKYAILALPGSNRRQQLHENILYFKESIKKYGIDGRFLKSDSPIQSMVFNTPQHVKEISAMLLKNKYDARAIVSPTVPAGQERIRFCIHSYNTHAEIQEILFLLSTFV